MCRAAGAVPAAAMLPTGIGGAFIELFVGCWGCRTWPVIWSEPEVAGDAPCWELYGVVVVGDAVWDGGVGRFLGDAPVASA